MHVSSTEELHFNGGDFFGAAGFDHGLGLVDQTLDPLGLIGNSGHGQSHAIQALQSIDFGYRDIEFVSELLFQTGSKAPFLLSGDDAVQPKLDNQCSNDHWPFLTNKGRAESLFTSYKTSLRDPVKVSILIKLAASR